MYDFILITCNCISVIQSFFAKDLKQLYILSHHIGSKIFEPFIFFHIFPNTSIFSYYFNPNKWNSPGKQQSWVQASATLAPVSIHHTLTPSFLDPISWRPGHLYCEGYTSGGVSHTLVFAPDSMKLFICRKSIEMSHGITVKNLGFWYLRTRLWT